MLSPRNVEDVREMLSSIGVWSPYADPNRGALMFQPNRGGGQTDMPATDKQMRSRRIEALDFPDNKTITADEFGALSGMKRRMNYRNQPSLIETLRKFLTGE